MEKLRKLLSHFVNGHRSEKRILPTADQAWLPFESSEEFQAARAEAEAQAEAIVQTYTVTRTVTKKKRDESLPSHLPRVEKVIEGNDAQTNCPAHGPREIIGYDTDRDAGLQASRAVRAGEEVSEVCLSGQSRLRRGFAGTSDLAGGRRSL